MTKSANYILVVPFIYEPYYQECMATIKLPSENIVIVDNTTNNRGVAGSWNTGIGTMREANADWLIVASAAMRFGELGGLDMIEALEKHPDAQVVNFAKKDYPTGEQFVRGITPGVEVGMFSWHLCAVSRKTIEAVGKFDPNFYPSYFEDIDYDMRLRKYYGDKLNWPIEPIDAHGTTIGHAVKFGGVVTPVNDLIAYFATKWGIHPSANQILTSYDSPFNDPNNSLAFWPPARGEVWNESKS